MSQAIKTNTRGHLSSVDDDHVWGVSVSPYQWDVAILEPDQGRCHHASAARKCPSSTSGIAGGFPSFHDHDDTTIFCLWMVKRDLSGSRTQIIVVHVLATCRGPENEVPRNGKLCNIILFVLPNSRWVPHVFLIHQY